MLLSDVRRQGHLLFLSGVVGVARRGDDLSFEDEVQRALSTVEQRLRSNGSGLPGILDVTVFLSDMTLYERLNETYIDYFARNGKGAAMPARTCVAVSALPLGARVELKVVAADWNDTASAG